MELEFGMESSGRIYSANAAKRFTNDFEISLDSRLEQPIAVVFGRGVTGSSRQN
jgi:hypothetical protein